MLSRQLLFEFCKNWNMFSEHCGGGLRETRMSTQDQGS